MQVECSDKQQRNVPDEQVQALLALTNELGIDPEDLDDDVHDCCDATASERVNNDPSLADLEIDEAQDVAYGEVSLLGSGVNNGGLGAQVPFLIAELGFDDATARVRAAAQ